MPTSWGTKLAWSEAGELLAIDSPLGAPQARGRWERGQCVAMDIWLPSGATITLRPMPARHVLLGDVLGIYGQDGALLSEMGPVCWHRSQALRLAVPAVMDPQKLPPGTGASLLGAIAHLAAARGDAVIHYMGPYPTAALYRALQACFALDQTEDEFCQDAMAWAMAGVVREHPARLMPAPLAWWESDNRTVVWAREQGPLVAVALDGHRLPLNGAGEAQVLLGGRLWCVAARAIGERAGDVVVTRYPLRACQSDAVGKPFPAALVGALTELVVDEMPGPLREAARQVGQGLALRWDDLGMVAWRDDGDAGLWLHAGLWELFGSEGMAAVLQAVLAVIVPPWQRRAAAVLAKTAT